MPAFCLQELLLLPRWSAFLGRATSSRSEAAAEAVVFRVAAFLEDGLSFWRTEEKRGGGCCCRLGWVVVSVGSCFWLLKLAAPAAAAQPLVGLAAAAWQW